MSIRISTIYQAKHSRSGHRLALTLAGVLVLVGAVLSTTPRLLASTGGTLYLSPGSSSYTVGDQFSVALRENSSSTSVNGVQATITFPSASLQLVSADSSGAFTVAPPDNTGSGSIVMTRGAYSGQTGDQLVSNLTFKALKAGTAAVSIDSDSSYVAATSDGSHITLSITNGSYSLANPSNQSDNTGSTPTPPATNSGGSSNNTNTNTGSSTSNSTSGSKSGSVKATPQGVSTPVTLPGDSVAQVSSPVTVQPVDTSAGKVQKVVYYLNGKQVAVETTAPYKYRVDTTKLHNGDYTLVSKTYYTNGKVTQTKQTLHVRNAASNLPLWELLVLVVIILILGGGGFIFRRRFPGIGSFFRRSHPQPPLPAAPITPLPEEQPVVTPIPVSTPSAVALPGQEPQTVAPPAVTPIPVSEPQSPEPPVSAQPAEPAPAEPTPLPVNSLPPTPTPITISSLTGLPIPTPGSVTAPTVTKTVE